MMLPAIAALLDFVALEKTGVSVLRRCLGGRGGGGGEGG